MERLLLIEDDDTTREVLALLLRADGWEVTEVADGEAALRAAEQARHDVVLSDLQLPGLSGAELARALRPHAGETARLIAMTATPVPSPPEGFDALLVKPFDAAAVRNVSSGAVPGVSSLQADGREVIAAHTLERLRAAMPAAQLRALFQFALDDADARVQAMETAEDDDAFRRHAHALKGSSAMVGALRVRSLAAQAEAVGMQEPAEVQRRITDIQQELSAVRSMLEGLSAERVS